MGLGIVAVLIAAYALQLRLTVPAQHVPAPEPARPDGNVGKRRELQPGPGREHSGPADRSAAHEKPVEETTHFHDGGGVEDELSGSILGHVWDGRNGLPLEGETVQIISRATSGSTLLHSRSETDPGGAFHFMAVPAGTWQVEIVRGDSLESVIPVGEVVVVPPGEATLEVELRCGNRALRGSMPIDLRGAHLLGESPPDVQLHYELELLNAEGVAVRRAMVFTRLHPASVAIDPLSANSEEAETWVEDGAFLFEGLEPLVYTLRATFPAVGHSEGSDRDHAHTMDLPADLRQGDLEVRRTFTFDEFFGE